jgi:hypothetical protein
VTTQQFCFQNFGRIFPRLRQYQAKFNHLTVQVSSVFE